MSQQSDWRKPLFAETPRRKDLSSIDVVLAKNIVARSHFDMKALDLPDPVYFGLLVAVLEKQEAAENSEAKILPTLGELIIELDSRKELSNEQKLELILDLPNYGHPASLGEPLLSPADNNARNIIQEFKIFHKRNIPQHLWIHLVSECVRVAALSLHRNLDPKKLSDFMLAVFLQNPYLEEVLPEYAALRAAIRKLHGEMKKDPKLAELLTREIWWTASRNTRSLGDGFRKTPVLAPVPFNFVPK